MSLRAALALALAAAVLCGCCWQCWAAPSPVPTPWLAVAVNPKKMSALVSDRFLSLTMDPMELSRHRKLGPGAVRTLAMARGLSPAYLRLAGPSSDNLRLSRYNGTVHEADVRAVSEWARASGWQLIFALNALVRGPDGAWDDQDARELLAFADHHGYGIDWQLGYDSRVLERAGLSGAELGVDLERARSLLAKYPRYQGAALLGPDAVAAGLAGLAGRSARGAAHFLQDLARVAAPSPDAVVWQPWSVAGLSEGRDPVSDPDLVREDVNRLLGRAAARRPLWIAESDEAPPRTFGGALEWARRVQVAARVGAEVIFRRWASPGEDHQPSPDFWVSLLHRRLCGRAVLDSRMAGNRSAASVTAHCTATPAARRSKDSGPAGPLGNFARLSYERGDVTLIAVNIGPAATKLAAKMSPIAGMPQRLVHAYILTPPGNDLGSTSALLNGNLLSLDNGGGLPALSPQVHHVDRDVSLLLPPHSVAFFVFPGVEAQACQSAPQPSPGAEEAVEVPLQLSSAGQEVQVQFQMDGLPEVPEVPEHIKSKTKDKLARTMQSSKKQKEVKFSDAQPLSRSAPSSLEDYIDAFIEHDPTTSLRSKRAAPPPAPRRLSPPEFFDRMVKAQVAHLNKRKHAQHAQHAHAQDDSDDALPAAASGEELTIIPVPTSYHPNNKDVEQPKAPRKPALKHLKLPKRPPLPRAPHIPGLPKRPTPPPGLGKQPIKRIPTNSAIEASLVDPERGVSAEDLSEENTDEASSFPSGAVLVEVGDSEEDVASREKIVEGADYVQDDEEDEHDHNVGGKGSSAQKDNWSQQNAMPERLMEDAMKALKQDQFYFAPGEFAASLRQGGSSNTVQKNVHIGHDGELGELDLIVEPLNVAEPSTPAPFEPHLEEFVIQQAPQLSPEQEQRAKQKSQQDLESFYQGAIEVAQEAKTRAKQADDLPSDDDDDINMDMLIELGKRYLREKKMALKKTPPDTSDESTQRKARTRRQVGIRTPSVALGHSPSTPRSRSSSRLSASELPKPPGSIPPRNILKELEQRRTARRERLREGLKTARTAARVKRSPHADEADRYLESFGSRDSMPVAPIHQHYHGDLLRRVPSTGRYRYGLTPPRRRQNVRQEVVKETNVVRYLPPEDEGEDSSSEETDESVERVTPKASRSWVSNRLPTARRRQQVYQPQDNVAAMWAGSPLSPYGRPRQDVPPYALARPKLAPAGRYDGLDSSEESPRTAKPTEVKTTRIVKTERTFESSSEESDNVSGVHYASLEPAPAQAAPSPRHHHHHHHHEEYPSSAHVAGRQHGGPKRPGSRRQRYEQAGVPRPAYSLTPVVVPDRPSKAKGQPVERLGRERLSSSSTSRWLSGPEPEPVATLPVEGLPGFADDVIVASPEESAETDSEERADASAPVIPPEAEGEQVQSDVGLLPEFPFRPPPGPKSQVVGFRHDDFSPGGWYEFAGARGLAPAPEVATPPLRPAAAPHPKSGISAEEPITSATLEEEQPELDTGLLLTPEIEPAVEKTQRGVAKSTVSTIPQRIPRLQAAGPPATYPSTSRRVPEGRHQPYQTTPVDAPESYSLLSRYFKPVPAAATPSRAPQIPPQVPRRQVPQQVPRQVLPQVPQQAPQQVPWQVLPQAHAPMESSSPGRVWEQPPADDLWSQPGAGVREAWRRPSQVASNWGGFGTSSRQTSNYPTGFASVSAPAAPRAAQWSTQRMASPQSRERLLDYNTHILRRSSPSEEAAKGPALHFASLGPAEQDDDALRVVIDGPSGPPEGPPSAGDAAAGAAGPIQAQQRPRLPRPSAQPNTTPAWPEWLQERSSRVRRALFPGVQGASKKEFLGDHNDVDDDLDDKQWLAETDRMRKKKLARQRQRDRDREAQDDEQHHIQGQGDKGFMSGVAATLLGKVATIIGYLGRLTDFKKSSST